MSWPGAANAKGRRVHTGLAHDLGYPDLKKEG